MALLIAEPGKLDRAVRGDVHERVAVVLGSRAFHHRNQRAVVDAADLLQVVLMTVPLEDGQYSAGCFEGFSHVCIVLHAVIVAHVEPLVGEHDHRLLGGLQVIFELIDLRRRDIGVGPLEVLPAIRLAVAAEAGVQHDEVKYGGYLEGRGPHMDDAAYPWVTFVGDEALVAYYMRPTNWARDSEIALRIYRATDFVGG